MKYLRPHRLWLGLLGFAILLTLSGAPLLRFLRGVAAQNLAQVKTERIGAEKALKQLKDDIVTARNLSGKISLAEAGQWLAPVDRLRAASTLEQEAGEAHFKRFTYNFTPEENVSLDTPAAGPQKLAASTLTMTAEAALDTDVYRFINGLHRFLPGRLRLQRFALERLNNGPLTAANLKFSATFEWISNGAAKTLAGLP